MKKFFILTALSYAILFCTPSFAQKKTIPGYYISVQNDTVKGTFSGYSQWSQSPSEVVFTPAGSGSTTKLTPQNCLNFILEGNDEYLSYTGQRLVNPIYDNEVITKRDSSFDDKKEEVITFLRLVTRTPVCELYVYADNKRTNFFYRLPGHSVVELRYKKYYDERQVNQFTVDRESHVNEITEYKDQLNDLFSEAINKRQLTSSLKSLTYTEDRLEMFLQELFAAEPVIHGQKNPLSGWIISAGASFNFVSVKASKFNVIAKEYGSSVSPLLSIGYITTFRRSFGKYFLYPQLNFFRYKTTGEINDGTFRKVTTYQADLIISGELNGGFNVVNQKSIRFYLSGGMGILTRLHNKRLDYKYLNVQQSSEPYTSSQESLSATTIFINASAGVVIKNKLLVMAEYLFPTSVDNSYSVRYEGLQLKVGYKVK
jgi:hypothetical protein